MSSTTSKYIKFGSATLVIVFSLGYLAYTGVQDSKSYYVTIQELRAMGPSAHTRRLRVAGNVEPGSIHRSGLELQFVLLENGQRLPVAYTGADAPPDTFKDNSQALAAGSLGTDGIFHASELQAKCASKYAPAQPGSAPAGTSNAPAKSMSAITNGSPAMAN